ncbi:Ulp1 protease family, carboxy-terminal domain protein [Medicago truncatula]|uniref:Ulp1 protease family, carboxy-terminal domain protein n=1 Tax=Medicago truncatula TaxID=3880 RepID=A0A072U7Y5_MEDTR|nr:Ulp1 protease family, carboxy-terminal domain protein [Medicago truncatula]
MTQQHRHQSAYRGKVIKKFAQTKKKSSKSKSKLTMDYQTNSNPLVLNQSKGKCLLDDLRYNKIKKNLVCKPEEDDDQEFYLNYQPWTPIEYDGLTIGFEIPEWIPITFRPPSSITMNDICAYTAAYIFMYDEEDSNGSTTGAYGDRKALRTLMPKCHVDQKVMNLVVLRQNWLLDSISKVNIVWYLPTLFSQCALDWHHNLEEMRRRYQASFMSNTSYVTKIFIPINDRGIHWYPMVVDFLENKIVLLDSLPFPEKEGHRLLEVLKLVVTATRTKLALQLVQCVVKIGVIKDCGVLNLSGRKKKGVGQSLNGDGI